MDPVAAQLPLLRFAEVQENRAVDSELTQSYLVAFRDVLTEDRQHFAPFPMRARSHMQALLKDFSEDFRRQQLRYLSSLNLSDLSSSFDLKPSWQGPALLQQELGGKADMASFVEVEFKNASIARETLQTWLDEGRIWFAEPNGISHLNGPLEDDIISKFSDNKQLTPWLSQVSFLPAIQQMAQLTSVAEPVIAVMDSGVDVFHPNLRAAIYDNEQGQNKLCKDDIYGCNTTVSKKEILGDGAVYPTGTRGFGTVCENGNEQCEHGTHVAGIIGARDADQYVGMCPYCKILVVKVVEIENSSGKPAFSIKDSSIIAGLAYVSGFKVGGEPLVRVINASFGKFEKSRSVELFIKALKNFGRGTLMVAAAGNEDTMKRQYPAGFDSVIAVSNVLSNVDAPSKSPSSNFGMWVDISAPGDGDCPEFEGILSSIPGGSADCKTGTSMASPVVAGIAGLILAKDPSLTASQLERRLLDTAFADKLYSDAVNNGYRPTIQGLGVVPLLGSGVVNAEAALDPTAKPSGLVVSTQRSDLVRSGCGTLGGNAAGIPFASLLGWFLPLFVVSISRKLRKTR